jgi:hypothetical protein
VATEEGQHVDERVGRLRGPEIQVDVRRTTRIVLGVGMALVAVLAVALFVVAVNQNSEVNGLQQRGEPVAVTVSSCIGNASGSGSTAAGYSCTGSFTLGGRRQTETIGGLTTFVAPGTAVAVWPTRRILTSSSPPARWRRRGDSVVPFVAPIILLTVLAGSVVVVLARRRQLSDRANSP